MRKEIQTKTFTSSGTSNLVLSKINIDRYTSLVQSKVLYQILMSVLKKKSKKIFFIDSKKKIKNYILLQEEQLLMAFVRLQKNQNLS